MKAIQIKIKLLERGLTVAAIARQMVSEPDITASEDSLRSMITDMINGRRYYPALADKVNAKFDLGLKRPKHLEPLPTRQAA